MALAMAAKLEDLVIDLREGPLATVPVPGARLCFGCWSAVPVPTPGWSDCTQCPTCGRHDCGPAQEDGVSCRVRPDEPVVVRRSRFRSYGDR